MPRKVGHPDLHHNEGAYGPQQLRNWAEVHDGIYKDKEQGQPQYKENQSYGTQEGDTETRMDNGTTKLETSKQVTWKGSMDRTWTADKQEQIGNKRRQPQWEDDWAKDTQWDTTVPEPKRTKHDNTEQRHQMQTQGQGHLPGWLENVPLRLRQRLVWQHSTSCNIPDGAIILFYVGKDNPQALDNILKTKDATIQDRLWPIDIERDAKTNNMLLEEPFNSLCTAAQGGKVDLAGGGPNCRTWTVRLHFPKKGGGIPLRGQHQKKKK